MFEYLAFNFAYIDLISLDCGIFNESLHNSMIECANSELKYYYSRDFMSRIKKRIKRAEDFIDYLEEIENQEFEDLNLDTSDMKFVPKLREVLEEQIEGIMSSAKNKKQIENEY